VRIGILGPLEVTVDGGTCEVSGARLRALLTRLALDAGRWVSVDALADALWGDALPADRANAVQSLVSRLRRAVPGVPVTSGPGGYQLDLPADAIDAHRFERLAASGRQSLADGHPHAAAETLGEALALWRGAALADLAGPAPAPPDRGNRRHGRRRPAGGAAPGRHRGPVEAELRTGPSAALVAELEELAAANPLRERLCGLRLEALAATGRPAQALAAYEEFRRRLADELGADPSPELKATHLAVCAARRGVAVASGRPAGQPAGRADQLRRPRRRAGTGPQAAR
jgi:DNA-binding SARP family transcriptional activator